MENPRVPLPGQSRPQRLGQPYHGLLIDGVLTLSTGRKITWPGAPYGDCYPFAVPGMPTIALSPTELALETAAGREWRNVALLTGLHRNYGGISVGKNAWLYAAPDGTVWRIECPQLGIDVQPIEPPLGRGRRWAFPANVDFEFKIRRFGVVSPYGGEQAPLITRMLPAVSLGGEFLSDEIPPSTNLPAAMRRNPWAADLPVMPINVEDVNSTGSRVLVGVNRTVEQSAGAGLNGRGYPYSWLMISVTGSGADIAIDVSVHRVWSLTGTSDNALGSPMVPEWWVWTDSGGATLSDPPDYSYHATATSAWNQSEMPVGFYFDAADQVQEVKIGPRGYTSVESGKLTINSDMSLLDLARDLTEVLTPIDVSLGPNVMSFGSVVLEFVERTAYMTLSIKGLVTGDLSGGSEQTWFGPSRYQGHPPGLGDRYPKSDINIRPYERKLGSAGVRAALYGAACLRGLDSLVVVRVTNKVYAVLCLAESDLSKTPKLIGDNRVVAIGSPAGWIRSSAIAQHWKASYNPLTGELATCEASHTRGWV